jgi:hypothetical protein
MSYNQISDIVFDCQICRKNIKFNVNNPSTYISVSDEEHLVGMILKTYEVSHVSGSATHVNLVIVDNKGNLRGFSDYYVEGEITPTPIPEIEFRMLFEDQPRLKTSSTFEFLMIINTKEQWIIDVISPKDMLPAKIAQSINQNIRLTYENSIEKTGLNKFDIKVGKKIFQTFVLGELIGVFIVNIDNKKFLVEDLISSLLPSSRLQNITSLNFHSLNTVIQILDEYPTKNLKVAYILKVLDEGSIKNPIEISDVSSIPPLVKSIFNQKSYPDHLLIAIISILAGQKTLNDLIKAGYILDFQEIIEIMDFISSKYK